MSGFFKPAAVFPQPGAGDVPLYRYWNPSVGDHFYTTDWSALGSGRYRWSLEGVQCYVRTQAQPPMAPMFDGQVSQLVSAAPSGRMPAPAAPARMTQAGSIPASFAGVGAPMSGPIPASFMSSRASFATGPGGVAFEAAREATFQTKRSSRTGDVSLQIQIGTGNSDR